MRSMPKIMTDKNNNLTVNFSFKLLKLCVVFAIQSTKRFSR